MKSKLSNILLWSCSLALLLIGIILAFKSTIGGSIMIADGIIVNPLFERLINEKLDLYFPKYSKFIIFMILFIISILAWYYSIYYRK